MLERTEGMEDLAMQRDYLEAYVCVTLGREVQALRLAEKYADVQHPTWREMFAQVRAHVQEAQGVDVEDPSLQQHGGGAAVSRGAAMEEGAKAEALLDLAVEGSSVVLEADNMEMCVVNFYRMDLELLFSSSPFMEGGGAAAAGHDTAQFSFLKPNLSVPVALDSDSGTTIVPVPEEFSSANVMVEAVGGGKRSSAPYFSHTMRVEVLESVGQVRVLSAADGTALECVYIKVYSKSSSGGPTFYKDGYTDRRGRFDYVSLSTSQLDTVARFAILVLSEGHGAVVKQASTPGR